MDVIVTGIPRSGTTLTCALIDSLGDSVCLSEPPWQEDWPRQMPDARSYVDRLCGDFVETRKILLAGGSVEDRRHIDGSAITDYHTSATGRESRDVCAAVSFSRQGLSADFLLGMKHNAHFSCVLDDLVECGRFRIVAVVRHPLAVIRSWRALDLPISRGRLPAGERFWPELAAITASTNDVLLRQVRIYELFCARYARLADRITLLRYENIVADPGLVARGFAKHPVRAISVRAVATTAQDADAGLIAARLRDLAPCACTFYPDI